MPTVYLVSANPFPDRPLKIDVEHRSILRRLPRSWDVKLAPAARLDDIVSDLRRFQPHIVHFSAHGSPTERLVLLNARNEGEEVSRATINNLFAVMKGNIRLVVLNSCYSQSQAELVASKVDCVIAVRRTLADVNAISYAEQFYEALSAKRSVEKAHQEASIILTDVPADHKPELIVKAGVSADEVYIIRSKRGKSQKSVQPPRISSAQARPLEEAIEIYGVEAERFTILKISNPDGSSVYRHEVEGLRSYRSEINSLRWRFLSDTGVVMAPTLEMEATDNGISWVTDVEPEPQSFDDVLTNLGSLHGHFVFDPPLQHGESRSFGWTTQVLNCDALTAWEFHNLYPKGRQVHVSKRPVAGKPSEYFAHLVWFPVRELRMGLRLPPSQKAHPQLRYFELARKRLSQGIPANEVFQEGELWLYPNLASEWAKDQIAWQRNTRMERLENDVVVSSAQAELTIRDPVPGSYYSLDWVLPDPPLPPDIDRLSGETEEIRTRLLAHRATRAGDQTSSSSEQIRDLFAQLHAEARKILGANEHSFSTTFMTWDRSQRRIVVVEGCRNDGKLTTKDWEFWLPFGVGLAGMCFRTATGAFRYQRDLDRLDPERPDMYLPVPGREPHTFLLALPIDHPDMTEEMGRQPDAQRCRQLVGVLSIGSTSPASHLREFCRLEVTDEVFARLREFRDTCQRKMDAISIALLEVAGVREPSRSDREASRVAEKTLEDGSSFGIIHQPEHDWRSPVVRNPFQFKVAGFDFDGTLLRGEKFVFSWELVWRSLGFASGTQSELKRRYREQAAKAQTRKERNTAYREWCERAVENFKQRALTREQLREICKPLRLTRNCREALGSLRKNGVVTALISGGISAILEDTFPDFREYFDFVFMNELIFDGSGVICGVRATTYDFEGKAEALALVTTRAHATREETVFIGDHFNDEAVMVYASAAIAYPPSDGAAESVSNIKINEDDLTALLPHILRQS